jgi:anti-anti-sigma factor
MLATVPGCEFEVQRGPDWLLVRVVSLSLEPSESSSLAEQIWSLLELHLTHRLVLQLDQVPKLNSHVLGDLLQVRRQIDAHGGIMRLCGLSPRNRRALRAAGLDGVFLPYRTCEEAVRGCSDPPRRRTAK